jgi:hypothetical protein
VDLSVGSPVAVVVGVLLVALGAFGATVAARGFDRPGNAARVPLRLVPFGVLIGGGAALTRGWDLAVGVVAGAVLVPVAGTLARLIEVRRHRWKRDGGFGGRP